MKGLSKIAAPLTNLTKQRVDVAVLSQTEECQDAIREMIKALTSEPGLMAPRHDRTFIVKTDAASIVGIGGVLSQVDDAGKERVVTY